MTEGAGGVNLGYLLTADIRSASLSPPGGVSPRNGVRPSSPKILNDIRVESLGGEIDWSSELPPIGKVVDMSL